MEIARDPRIRSIPWRDLRSLTRLETFLDLVGPLPWLLASWWCATTGRLTLALAFSFVFFLAGLRLIHDVFHHNLGLPRWLDELLMVVMSLVMLGSMHAVQWNHLRHHRHCMDDDDLEAMSARLPAWQALVWGPVFPLLLHRAALVRGRARVRCWVCLELALNLALVAAVGLGPRIDFLRYHMVAMAVGQCLTAFFAVWTVHHDCDRSHFIARTLRGRLKTWLTFNMFYHVEHHLFPQLPTRRLPALAERLDAAAPELREKQVF